MFHFLRTGLDLLSTVGWQVEGEDCEERDSHAGDDQVDGIEERLPSHCNVKCNI